MVSKIKPGVKLLGLRPEIAIAIPICKDVFFKYGYDFVITSGVDGQHKRQSAHYTGRAFDIRTRDINPLELEKIREQMAENLSVEFDVILEGNHYHVEWDVK